MARGSKTPSARPRSPNARASSQVARPNTSVSAQAAAGPNSSSTRPRSPNARASSQVARPNTSASVHAASSPNSSSTRPRSPNPRPSSQVARPHAPGQLRPTSGPTTFSPPWLATQLATLVPGYPDTPLCVALSGGVDSTALLAALAGIHPRPPSLRALHVNHGLRPAARQWAQHCRTLARRLHVPLKVLTTKVTRPPGASLEAAARDARYDLFAAALNPGEVLLLAHHADDQLETVLLQLLRGSGLPGLSAMPASAPFARGLAVRPLLSRPREELEAWVHAQRLTWIEDDSNADESLNRNYLRRQVLPLLRVRWPGAPTAVARSARHVAEAQSLLDRLARADIERASYGESLSVKALRALPADRLNNALRFWIDRAHLRAPDTRRLAEISGPLLNAREDANPFVEWGEEGARVQRQGDLLTLTNQGARAAPRTTTSADSRPAPAARSAAVDSAPSRTDSPSATGAHSAAADSAASRSPSATNARSTGVDSRPPRTDSRSAASTRASAVASRPTHADSAAAEPPDLTWSWRDSPKFDLPHHLGKLQLQPDAHGPIDLDALPHPLTIRWRRGGERLAPRRGGPRRALKNLLQESHVPASERARLPLLFSTTPMPAAPEHTVTAPAVAAPRVAAAPSASTASRGAARSAHFTASSAPSASTPGAEKLIAVADLLLDETVQATSATRRRARLRWVKSSP